MVEDIAVEEPVVEEIVAEKPGVKRDQTINVASEPVITNPDSMENVKNENEDEEGSIAVGNTCLLYTSKMVKRIVPPMSNENLSGTPVLPR